MRGYYENKSATENSFDTEGFLRTGDVGYVDEDKFLFILDR